MKKIILIFFLLFVVGIGSFVAWFAYSFNGENYKKELIEDLTNATGRAVQIEGPVTLSWVPLPTVVISDLSISNQEGSPDPVMFSVKQIYAEIDWKSLFKKPLVIKKVILRSPSLLLERVRSYQTNFDFPFLFKGEEEGDLKKRKSFSLTINEMEVEDGEFTYSNAISKEKLRIKGIDGSGKISSLNGPFSFSGSFLVNESKESIDFTIDKIEAFQPVKIDLSLNDKDSKTSIRGKGSVFYDPNKPDEWMTLEGIISSKNISLFLEKVGIQNWPKEQVVGSFTFKITPNKTVLESLTIRQGQGEEETSFFMGMQSPKNDGKKIPTLAIKNIDLEKWFPLIEKISTETYFNHWKTDFYVQIEEAKFHSELSKQIFAEGKFENGVFDFSNFVVQLPYQTSFSGKGFFELQKRKIDADIQFQSEEFRPFIEWLLQKKVSVLSKNQLKKAQLRGHLIAQSNDINFKVKETTVDEVQLSGNLGLKNSSFNAFFEIKDLVLDTYWESGKEILKSIFSSTIDGKFNIKCQNVKLRESLFNQLAVKGSLNQDVLNLEEINGTGSDGSVFSGKFSAKNLKNKGEQMGNLETKFSIPNLERFLKMLTLKEIPTFLNQEKKLSGTFNYSGTQKNGDFKTDILFDKVSLKGEGKISDIQNLSFSDTRLLLSSSEIQNFISFFEKGKNVFPDLKGPFELSVFGKKDKDNLFLKEFSLKTGNQTLNGNFNLNMKESSLKADLVSPSLNLNSFLPSLRKINFLSEKNFEIKINPKWQAELTLKAEKASYEKQNFTQLNGKVILKDMVLTCPFLEAFSKNKEKAFVQGKIIWGAPVIAEGKMSFPQLFLEKDSLNLNSLSLGEGTLALNTDFKMSGNSWNAFLKSARAQGQFSWVNGKLKGINLNEFSSLVKRVLKQKQLEDEIDIQIEHALSNGENIFSIEPTDFKVEQTAFTFEGLRGKSSGTNFSADKGTYSLTDKKLNVLLSIVLDGFQNFPSLDLLIKNNAVEPQISVFKSALKQEIKIEIDQQQQEEKRQKEDEAKKKQKNILEQAQEILLQSEEKVENAKSRFALKPSEELQGLLEEIENISSEVRLLAIRSDLNGEQLNFLQEKSKLLNVYLKKLDAFWQREDVLKQRENVKKLPPLAKARIEEIVQIYRQNPQAPVLAGLVQKSKDEEKKINEMIQSFSTINELDETKQVINEIKNSFMKIQKALNFARQFDSETGMVPSISGVIEEI